MPVDNQHRSPGAPADPSETPQVDRSSFTSPHRCPSLLEAEAVAVSAESRWGLDIGATTTLLGTCTSDGARVHAQTETPAEPHQLADWLRKQLPVAVGNLDVAFPGGVSTEGHVTYWPNRPRWNGFALHKGFDDLADTVTIADDGVAAAIGETRHGVAHGIPDVLVVVLGTGLGGAVVLQHALRPARRGDPRTLGHFRISPYRLCPCGRRGCAQLALRTLPPDDAVGEALSGWPEGVRLAGFFTDLLRSLHIGTVVLTGGLMERPVLRAELTALLATDDISVLVPQSPVLSSLLGAAAGELTA